MSRTADFVSVLLPFDDTSEWSALREADVTAMIEALGNPAGEAMRRALDATGVIQFLSINVIPAPKPGKRAHLFVEVTADRPPEAALRRLDEHAGDLLFPIVARACGLAQRGGLLSLLIRHQHAISYLPFPRAGRVVGLPFLGIDGMSLAQIRDNRAVAEAARKEVAKLRAASPQRGPLQTFRLVYEALRRDDRLRKVLEAPQPPLAFVDSSDAPWFNQSIRSKATLARFIWPAVQLLLSLLVVPYLISFAVTAWAEGTFSITRDAAHAADSVWRLWLEQRGIARLLHAAGVALGPALLVLAALVGLFAVLLRRDETANTPRDGTPDATTMARMMSRENATGHVQNHMISVTERRRGLVRRLSLSLGFYLVVLANRLGMNRAGFLASIGTIHSARWVMVPGTRQLVFVSNFDGSWESYLEDFVTKAARGLTGIWGNTDGYPVTKFLLWHGGQDGDRMKRYARRSMQPTAFWYSALPDMDCEQIRRQAIVTSGLRAAARLGQSPSDAEAWLDLFATIPRPDYALEYEEIQTLMFGGLSDYPASRVVALGFGAPTADEGHPYRHVQRWLAELDRAGAIAFGDKPHPGFVGNIAFSAQGLRKLGLTRELDADPEALPHPLAAQGFPAPFALGMAHDSRKRLLADPPKLAWCDDTVDAVLLLYASSQMATKTFAAEEQRARDAGLTVVRTIATGLKPFDAHAYADAWHGGDTTTPCEDLEDAELTQEPFGFVDGISQPTVRGFPGRQGKADEVHSVEPGEFILGYRDNRGYFPPSPQVAREMADLGMDPAATLPSLPPDQPLRFPKFDNATSGRGIAPRDFGRNGSYLVIRELAQNVAGFEQQLDRLAGELAHEPLNPHCGNTHRTREWIAAKMVGRWRDGSSLVDHPFAPAFYGRGLRPVANNFRYRDDDPQGMRCPFGSHIRRSFPRDSMSPNDPFELAVTNRHRLLRRGRPFLDDKGEQAGTLFLCFNADLERQFEFVQQTWVGADRFHGLEGEVDPFAGHAGADGPGATTCLSVPGPSAPLVLNGIARHVALSGGGYFFLPSRRALWFLAGEAWASDKAL